MKDVKWYGGKSKQYWISTYNNRIVKAVWLTLFIGILTAVKPFMFGMAIIIFNVGLSLPEILMELLLTYTINTPLSILLAAILIICSIMAMKGKISTLKIPAFILLVDLLAIVLYVFLTKPYSDQIFIIVVTLTYRIISLAVIIFALRAYTLRSILKEQMAKADEQYDKEKKTNVKYIENEDPYIEGDIFYCPNCGAKVDSSSNFCEECGSKLE
ncbi:zinc ribbon domain-containing protein [Tissierella creatinini]|nr:zinc ribbon domain-containing protein [Tissierella creatinini]TJX60130.1 zinc ribbon domain-containing protein [Soehngenia saccharolytica]